MKDIELGSYFSLCLSSGDLNGNLRVCSLLVCASGCLKVSQGFVGRKAMLYRLIRRIFCDISYARKSIYHVARMCSSECVFAQFGDVVWSQVPEARLLALRGLAENVRDIHLLFEGRVIPGLGKAILADNVRILATLAPHSNNLWQVREV